MKSGISNKQKIIWTKSYVLWVMQLARNILGNNEQHILETVI